MSYILLIIRLVCTLINLSNPRKILSPVPSLSFSRCTFYLYESDDFLLQYVQYSVSWICPSHVSILPNISDKFLLLFLYFLITFEFLCNKEEARMKLVGALQMNFQVIWVVAPCRLANSCLCLGVTNLPSKCRDSTVHAAWNPKAWNFNKHKGVQRGNKFPSNVHLAFNCLVSLQIFWSICETVDIQQWAKPIKRLPCYVLSVSRWVVVLQNEHKNVTFWLNKKNTALIFIA